MICQYTQAFLKRTWSVDAVGIHLHRSGRLIASIAWDDLDRLSCSSARSVTGKGFGLPSASDRRAGREFYQHASREWQNRYPERWARNRRRNKRAGEWAVYLGLPLLALGPSIAFYILDWMLGWPQLLAPDLKALNRITVPGALFIGAYLCWFRFRTRRFVEPEVPANGSQSFSTDTDMTSSAGDSRS